MPHCTHCDSTTHPTPVFPDDLGPDPDRWPACYRDELEDVAAHQFPVAPWVFARDRAAAVRASRTVATNYVRAAYLILRGDTRSMARIIESFKEDA